MQADRHLKQKASAYQKEIMVMVMFAEQRALWTSYSPEQMCTIVILENINMFNQQNWDKVGR